MKVDEITGDDLLARAAAGSRDRAAFGELVQRHHARVLGLLRHLARDRAVADDLAAQTFLKAWEKLASFRGDSSARFGAWLSRIAYRQFLQRARRSKLEQRIFSSDELPDVAAPVESLPSGGRVVAQGVPGWAAGGDERASFNALLAACTQVQAETLYMSFVLELTHEEIARVTDRPLGTVKSHITRGKAAIKASLENDQAQLSAQVATGNLETERISKL